MVAAVRSCGGGATVTEQGGTPSLARGVFVVIILLIMLLTDVSFHVVRACSPPR